MTKITKVTEMLVDTVALYMAFPGFLEKVT